MTKLGGMTFAALLISMHHPTFGFLPASLCRCRVPANRRRRDFLVLSSSTSRNAILTRGHHLYVTNKFLGASNKSFDGNTNTGSSKSKLDDFLDNLDDLLGDKESERSSRLPHKNQAQTTKNGWRMIDWKSRFLQQQQQQQQHSSDGRQNNNTLQQQPKPSPVQRHLVRNRMVYFKRDDQLKLSSAISGNKARKMLTINEMGANTSEEEFPSCVVSYGGPQSNAMVALAAVVHFQNQKAIEAASSNTTTNNDPIQEGGEDEEDEDSNALPSATPPLKRFVYYTKKLPKFLRNQPSGNLFRAQTLGMELIELSQEEYGTLFGGEYGGPIGPPPALDPPVPGDSIWVREIVLQLYGETHLCVHCWLGNKHLKIGALTVLRLFCFVLSLLTQFMY